VTVCVIVDFDSIEKEGVPVTDLFIPWRKSQPLLMN